MLFLCDQVAKDIEDFSNALNHLKQQMQKIQELVYTEQVRGHATVGQGSC